MPQATRKPTKKSPAKKTPQKTKQQKIAEQASPKDKAVTKELKRQVHAPKLTKEQKDIIIAGIATTNWSVAKIAKQAGTNYMSVYRALASDKDFGDMYAQAKVAQSEFMVDAINDRLAQMDAEIFSCDPKIANAVVQRHRVYLDTHKWIASKLKPDKYGDHLDVKHRGGVEMLLTFNGRLDNNAPNV